MNDDFRTICERFVNNKKVLSKAYAFSSGDIMSLSAALLLTGSNISPSVERIKECDKILKEETSAISDYRGNVRIPLVCRMLIAGMPAETFRRIDKAYKALKAQKKWSGSNEYKILAAMIIQNHAGSGEYERYAARANEIYLKMKGNHRAITNDEDIPFAAILATSGISPDQLVGDMELCYSLLRKKFHDRNSVQSLSQVLALDSRSAEEKCNRVIELFDALKNAGHKFGTDYELTTLGTLSLIDKPIEEIVALLVETDSYLKPIRGFGNFSLGAKHRRLYAAQLCINYFCPKQTNGNEFALGSTLALAVSMQASMVACIGASVAVTAAH